MSDETKQQIVKLVVERDLSSIELISEILGIDQEQTVAAILELVEEGQITGNLTSDQTRFFKAEVELSEKPVIPRKREEAPGFLDFDPRPGRIVAALGTIVFIVGIVGYLLFPDDFNLSNVFAVVMLIGIVLASCGCYYLGTRKTP
jgi:transposase-like protein